MGDPASIGPEISVKALGAPGVYEICRPIIIGDAGIMSMALKSAGREDLRLLAVESAAEAGFAYGTIDVLDVGAVSAKDITPGEISAATGDASYRYVEKAVELAMAGALDATVTNAISKEAINLAGHRFAGHTEIYAKLTGTAKYSMMLAHGHIRVVHVSTHVSLRQACDLVRRGRVLEVIKLADSACKALGISRPVIAVAGLNPHSGEAGMFGTEEVDEIIPAIADACAAGIDAQGPVPPDTVFPKARGGLYDIVVAMYHDQGHIPLKLEGFVYDKAAQAMTSVEGVNITLGLPIIRTSVDHGTAMDKAYQGTAGSQSLTHAIEYAARFAKGL
ncbi:MAG: 4-hydroxythreonine-4-phosphate dehydrogenase PdxA [Defluviitaleaceae bacterium]|nr:4-hydroxythreonine-4-phosphate dehydrogenase PdxA [Defluviitaleaceae bacterium]